MMYHCANCNQDYDFATQGAICPHLPRSEGGKDRLEPWPKRAPETAPAHERAMHLLRHAALELNHASVFIRTRQKMHPDGVKLYDELLGEIAAFLKDQQSTEGPLKGATGQ